MSKEKARLRISRQGAGLAKIDGDSVQSFWWNLSLAEKRYILRFEDPELVECLFSIWQRLCISDMTCYVVGIGSQDGASKKAGNEFFAIEGFISQSAVLHEAAFYAKLELVGNEDLFEIVQKWVDGPLWVGRPILHRRDWPSLFRTSVNSWSELVRQIFKLVESALYHAERASRLNPTAGSLCSAKEASPSKSAKRRERKKQSAIKVKAEADVCPVCDGTGILLDDPCPLCVSDAEDPAHSEEILDEEEENDASDADEVEDPEHEECGDEQEEDAKDEQEEEETTNVTQSDDEKEDTSRNSKDGENDEEDEEWEAEVLDRKFGIEMEDIPCLEVQAEDEDITHIECGHFEYEEHEDTTTGWRTKSRKKKKKLLSRASRNLIATWSSGWRSIGRRCEAVGGHLVLFERPMSQSAGVPNKVLGERAKAGVVRATVKNTFVHLLPDAPVKQGLPRSSSLPSL